MSLFLTDEAAVLQREVIMPGVREYMQSATPLLKYFEKEIQPSPTGSFLVVFNKTRNNNAAAGRSETGTLPDPFSAEAGRALVPSKQLYTRTAWSGKVIAATKTKDSLVDAIVYQTESAAEAHKHAKNRQLNGDGTDALGYWVSEPNPDEVIVTDKWGNVGGDLFQSGVTKVDLIDVTGGAHVEQAGLSLTRGALQATGRFLSASENIDADAASGDYFVPAGAIEAGPVGRHLMGIQGTISAGNPPLLADGLQGVDPDDVPEFAAQIVGDDGSDYTDWVELQFHLLQRVETEIDRNSNEGSEGIAFILTSPPGFDTYLKTAREEKITVNEMELDGGFKGISFNMRPIVKDKHTRLGAFYFINPGTHKLFMLEEMGWDESAGSMFYRLEGGDKDGLGATLKEYSELGVITRNANGALVGIKMLYN